MATKVKKVSDLSDAELDAHIEHSLQMQEQHLRPTEGHFQYEQLVAQGKQEKAARVEKLAKKQGVAVEDATPEPGPTVKLEGTKDEPEHIIGEQNIRTDVEEV